MDGSDNVDDGVHGADFVQVHAIERGALHGLPTVRTTGDAAHDQLDLALERNGRLTDRFFERLMFPICDRFGQPIALPCRRRGSQRCFWASLPYSWIGHITSAPCTETKLRMPESPRSSSCMMRP